MKVKVGDHWYSSDDQPICVFLEGKDRENIESMPYDGTRYASAPDDWFDSSDEFLEWMD